MNEKEIKAEKEKISLPLLIANISLICFVVSFGFMVFKTKEAKIVEKQPEKILDFQAFDSVHVQAQSFIVWDVSMHRIVYSKEEKTVRPLASITKIMTAVTALSLVPKSTTVTIKKDFLAQEGDSGLYVDEKWTLKNLLDFSLMVSSNDGARSIAAVAGAFASSTNNYDIGLKTFIASMNKKAHELGFSSMRFKNETGLDVTETESGGYGSAEDVARLIEYAMKTYPNIFEATRDKKEIITSLDKKHSAINTNDSVAKIPNLVASKTGYTALSGGNLAVVFDAGVGRPVIIVVLGSTYEGRFADVQILASSTLAYFRSNE